MKDGISSNSSADSGDRLHRLLSSDEQAWSFCSLGPSAGWSEPLQAYATTLSALPYPAAVLWGDEYVLFHNKMWDDAGGITHQGQPHRDRFSSNTVNLLRHVTEQNSPQQMHSAALLQKVSTMKNKYPAAILSPLRHPKDKSAAGVMVQLMPATIQLEPTDVGEGNGSGGLVASNNTAAHDMVDNAPIDEHPFFRRFAEMLPSGLAILDRNAQAVFVNQHFYDLTTLKDEEKEFTSWPQSIDSEDYDRVMEAYRDAFKSQKQLRTEFRAKGEANPWRLLLLTPLGDENLQHVSLREYGGFICSIVDITSEKSAELAERKSARQARERKEQQERFIDMISHEIRNPLSAVLHCAEDINDAISNETEGGISVESIREAVETINLCVLHQKNIVDDVLSFSKLDASLLSLVPRPSEPGRQLQNTLKMFQHEFRKQQLEFKYSVNDIYQEILGPEHSWVLADLARASQVLINLITNAIKFTHRATGKKLIECMVAASLDRPKSYPPNVVFFESDNLAHKMDATNTSEWGNGEVLYIMVAVRDTGIGISEEGQQRLFERFRQATPKTEEVYGGSGLGLNISRKICHLHGGEIGVSSKEGEGSTFGFFFKVRRSEPPQYPEEEQAEEREGDDRLRDKIEGIGQSSPSELTAKEPFEWQPGKGEKKTDEAHPETTGESETNGKEKEKGDHSTSVASPSKEKQEGDKIGESQRPSLSTTQQSSGGRMASADLQSPISPTIEESDRPITTLNRTGTTRAHVLLVEDNVINQKIVYRKLEAKGFNVTTANNGQEAVEAVRAAPRPSTGEKGAFDVILMDQEMPVLDGNGATKRIRELEQGGEVERVPILGVTANVRGAQQDEMLASGMDDVISKPYKIEEMVSALWRLVDSK